MYLFLHLFDSWKIHNNSTLLCQDFGVFSWKAKVYSKLKMYITVEMPSRVMSGSSCWRAIIITICSLTKETVRRSVKLRLTRVKLLENYSTPIYMHSLIHRGALKNLLWNFLIYHLYSNLSLLTLFSLRDVVHCSEIGFSILMKFNKNQSTVFTISSFFARFRNSHQIFKMISNEIMRKFWHL